MRFGAGEFDRRIRIEQASESRDTGGNTTVTYPAANYIYLSAHQRHGTTSEKMEQARQQSTNTAIYTTRYYAGINAKDRLYDEMEANYYEIHNVRTIGRKEYLEITASWQD